MVADMLEGMRFALGPAMSARRDAIDAIGGIRATADYYSDDFELGNKIWQRGYRVLLSHNVVNNVLTPRPLLRTLGDQLRWMKSTRYSRPAGHVGTGLTYAMAEFSAGPTPIAFPEMRTELLCTPYCFRYAEIGMMA